MGSFYYGIYVALLPCARDYTKHAQKASSAAFTGQPRFEGKKTPAF